MSPNRPCKAWTRCYCFFFFGKLLDAIVAWCWRARYCYGLVLVGLWRITNNQGMHRRPRLCKNASHSSCNTLSLSGHARELVVVGQSTLVPIFGPPASTPLRCAYPLHVCITPYLLVPSRTCNFWSSVWDFFLASELFPSSQATNHTTNGKNGSDVRALPCQVATICAARKFPKILSTVRLCWLLELAVVSPQQTQRISLPVETHISVCPLVTVGWNVRRRLALFRLMNLNLLMKKNW